MTLKERLIRLSGDDHRIVKDCDASSQGGFFLIGLFVPLVFVICWVSGFITFSQVFDNVIAGAVISLFFAWMITNLYRLLLYTFSKNPLPQVNKKAGKLFSRGFRAGFVCFIAAMIAKPIESVLYAGLLDRDIVAFKDQAKQASLKRIAFYYQRQIDEILQLSRDTRYSQQLVQGKVQSRRQSILQANAVIDSSGYFLQRLRLLGGNHPSCWWVTAFFQLIFLYPLALKYHLKDSCYYQLKGASERRKIDLNYYVFRKKYAALFEKLYDRRITFSEHYEDPPYNTLRKQDQRRFLTEKEFISELYHV